MVSLPYTNELIEQVLSDTGIRSASSASIREVVAIIKALEEKSGVDFIRMDMGVPGVPAPPCGIEAEIAALYEGKPAIYGQIDGIPILKQEASRFVKNFIDIDVSARSCIVTAGSMMGSMITFMVAAKREVSRQGVLFIDPGFPVQKKQATVLNLPIFSFDIYKYRGEKLYDKLEDFCAKNGISVIVYSNPNNPTWICLTETELKAIAKVANAHDIIVVEDLAYFGMDFRHDYGVPGKAPFQPSIAKYTFNYFILFSSSKVFSYAGQRCGIMMVSDSLYERVYPDLLRIGDNDRLGPALVQDGVYVLSAGASHTAQYGLAGMLKASNEGEYKFLEHVKIYGEKAREMKKIFIDNGFRILYDKDGDEDLADGFYFTVTYSGLDSEELSRRFFRSGLGTVSLKIMGSREKPGVRISTSKIDKNQFNLLNERLIIFNNL
ncbi:MAG: pyridoxal phosphate-dependent aminotransferase [Bacteroidales bacterium]|nr:pyridoxal phosphate-dependent aminotransferase [Bacteroidales bacterium]MBN2819573.1 pyridoxal phosphate-dependent aminotransferase [Bacteroidales bacterium]